MQTAALLVALSFATSALALGPGGGTQITWHPFGCKSNQDIMGVANPGDTATAPPCINNPFGWPPTGNPSGGWQLDHMPQGVSFEVRQGPPGGLVCGPELILRVAEDGCYDLPNLANEVWWDFCVTGVSCAEMGQSRQRRANVTSGIMEDDQGSYVLAGNGERVPVLFQESLTQVTPSGLSASYIERRQGNTFNPPQSCFNDGLVCQSFADSGELKATCVNCVAGLGQGTRASANVDCRGQSSSCPITVSKSITVTDTISLEVSLGVTIGDTGMDGANGDARFGFGVSFSVATTRGQTLGLSVPAGHIGFLQYQPPAVLGTVVSSLSTNEFCNDAGHNICGAAPGILATANNDNSGQYSIVVQS
ncbi:hypothetical protein DL769_006894 [Monosporascus sp. CRB-8-3]|nr:hypothetical protein DL769_006894 [Monosporascus sp. CRB-8-3]